MNNKILEQEAITFDDVLILPNYTTFPREAPQLEVELHEKIKLKLPITSSPMDKVTEAATAITMAKNGGLGFVHRSLSVEAQAQIISEVKNYSDFDSNSSAIDQIGKLLVAAAVGVGNDFKERVEKLVENKVDAIVVDTAHGYAEYILKGLKYIKEKFPHIVVVSGNIATYDGAKACIEYGADILRVGMGPGSICTTRIISGTGVPQLTAVSEAVRATEGTSVSVIADGGIRQAGDIAKAFAFGAKAVMLGSLLAGFDESPGEIVTKNDQKFKIYRGMGSISAMKKGSAERYGQQADDAESNMIAEGVESLVEYKGKMQDYLNQLSGSIKSAFYYQGAIDMNEFYKKSKCVKISSASRVENHPHIGNVTNAGSNYN